MSEAFGKAAAPQQPVRYAAVLALIATSVTVFVLVAAIGNRQAARDERVLGQLDPLIERLRAPGGSLRDWSVVHAERLGWATTVLGATIAVAGLVLSGRRAAPVTLLAVAVALTTWGEVLLLDEQTAFGTWCYAGGFLCALGLGIWCPMSPAAGADPSDRVPSRPRWRRRECLYVLLLTIVALLSRAYALNELPNFFEGEMAASMLSSRTWAGLHEYVPEALSGNSNGFVHLLPQMLSFELLGTSIYSLRLVSVAFGVVAVPLFYCLLRHIGSPAIGVVGAGLLITAPDQLFWSRDENTPFIPLAVLAIVTVYVSLRMVERLSLPRVLAAALWMPVGRYFYLPGMVMLAYPLLLYGHALLFVRKTWRTLWYVVPLMGCGVALWTLSLTALNAAFHNWESPFVSPVGSVSAGIWNGAPQHGTRISEQLLLNAAAVGWNLGTVMQAMTYRGAFSQWYLRADNSRHPTITNVALVVMLVLGLGYLFGCVRDQRAFALLLWVGLGMLPGILSLDPAPRRLTVMFPGLYAIVAIAAGNFIRLVRDRGGRLLGRVAVIPVAIALIGVTWTSLTSHFQLPIAPLSVTKMFRFSKPLFEESNVIFHNLDPTWAFVLALGNADRFVEPGKTPCFRHVSPREWLNVGLRQPCSFTDPVHRFTASRHERTALNAAYNPRRITFLLLDRPHSRPYLDLLTELYPQAPVRMPADRDAVQLVALTVERRQAEALRSPLLSGSNDALASDVAAGLLRGARLTPVEPNITDPSNRGVSVQGGVLLERDGWYRFALTPACPRATWTIEDRFVSASDVLPLLAGIHPFEVALPDPGACALPLELSLQTYRGGQMVDGKPPLLVAPRVVAARRARAPSVTLYPGYGDAQRFGPAQGLVLDFGLDGDGTVSALFQEGSVTEVRRFAADGRVRAAWPVTIPPTQDLSGITVAPNGTVLVLCSRTTMVYDRSGKPVAVWNDAPVPTSELAVLPDGRALSSVPDHAAVAVLRPDGTVEREWEHFEGGPGGFFEPMSVRVHGHQILVLQSDGLALLFANPSEVFDPHFVRSFHVDLSAESAYPRGATFDGPDYILVPDEDTRTALAYGSAGQRLMAADPARDLNNKGFGGILRLQASRDQLYVLDNAHHLWRLPH